MTSCFSWKDKDIKGFPSRVTDESDAALTQSDASVKESKLVNREESKPSGKRLARKTHYFSDCNSTLLRLKYS